MRGEFVFGGSGCEGTHDVRAIGQKGENGTGRQEIETTSEERVQRERERERERIEFIYQHIALLHRRVYVDRGWRTIFIELLGFSFVWKWSNKA